MSIWLEVALLVLLTAINGFLTGSEIAFVSLREGQLNKLKEEGHDKTVALASSATKTLAVCQIGVTVSAFLASASAAVTLEEPLGGVLPFGHYSNLVAIIGITLILSYTTLVLGELVPKRIAMQHAEGWAVEVSGALSVIARFSRPVVWLLSESTAGVMRLVGQDPYAGKEEVTDEEIASLVEEQEEFSAAQKLLVIGALEVDDRRVREILVPRPQVIAVDGEELAQTVFSTLLESGHSRCPVYEGDMDKVLGVVHLRDVAKVSGPVREYVREAVVVPESLEILGALTALRERRQQLAVVINEHGGMEGIITMEDILEEIVGEVYDEFDKAPELAEWENTGEVRLPGNYPIHELDEIGIELESNGEYSTVAGFVLDALGHIPEVGETTTLGDWEVEVEEVNERAITAIRLRRK